MRIVIVANGKLEASERLRVLWYSAALRIAADGGAANARQFLGMPPQVVVGDLDSLDATTRAWCADAEFIQHPRAKDQTDLELALDVALARGASEVVILGAQGGRFDHALANLLLLVKAAQARVPARIAGADFDAWVVWERAVVEGRVGETVSLIPLSERVDGIVTHGLRFPLRSETLWLGSGRGVSNVLVTARAEVSVREGLLLVVQMLETGD